VERGRGEVSASPCGRIGSGITQCLLHELARLFARRHAASFARDLLAMHAPRFGGKVFSTFSVLSRMASMSSCRLRACAGVTDACAFSRDGSAPLPIFPSAVFRCRIAADRAREQAAGFLALEVIRRSEPTFER